MKYLSIVLLLTFIGCKSGSGGGGGGTSTSATPMLSGTFNDTSVTAFSYTTGTVFNRAKQGLLNFALPTANAAVTETFSCVVGENLSFSLTALGNVVDVDTTCTTQATVELAIRIELLESLDGSTFSRTVTDAAYKNGQMDFTGGFTWGATYYVVDIYKADNAGADFADIANPLNTLRPCYTAYWFNKATGTVTMNSSRLVSESQNGGSNTADFCTNGGETTGSFRFINGYMEMDLSGNKDFNPERGIHSVTSLTCFNATTDVQCESTYEKWEI